MKNKILIVVYVLFLSLVGTNISYASGGDDGGNDDSGFGNDSIGIERQERVVDQAYELGKAIYTGRKHGEPKLSYCVNVNGERLPVKRKALKQFKKSSFSNLAKNLYNCDNPESQVVSELSRDSFLHVLYYLDKRYRLALQRS